MQLMRRYKSSNFYRLVNFHDELAKGRSCVLLFNSLNALMGCLSGGLFYTSFLMTNGINLVNISIITFIPYIANCFSVFAPSILERFPRRKWVLASLRMINYTLTLLGITLLPRLVADAQLRIVCLVAITLIANICESIVASGYSVWHLNFMPENVRTEYLSTTQLMINISSCGFGLLAGLVADLLAGSPHEDTIIVAFRYLAFAVAAVGMLMLVLPKEYEYPKTRERPRLRDIVVLPMKQRKFLLTTGICFLWTYFINIPNSVLNYYLLENVGVSYTFINVINVCYPLFLIIFLPFWKNQMRTIGWWKTFAISAGLLFPTTIMYACVTAGNYLWLLPTLRLIQHYLGVGHNIAYANLPYINLPNTDQTNYVTFQTLTSNMAVFLGMMTGTWFVAAFPDIVITMFGMEFVNIQLLQLVTAFGQALVPGMILVFLRHLQPDDPARIYG